MEFTGEAIDNLSMDGRFTMSNMAIEAGGKAGMCRADSKTSNMSHREPNGLTPFMSLSPASECAKVYEWDVSKMEPQVAAPHLPSNVKPVSALKDVKIDQAVIGSCTNGRLEDLRLAASVIKGRKWRPGCAASSSPATQQVYLDAMKEGLVKTFINAGCAFSTPTCGPCLGRAHGHTGCRGTRRFHYQPQFRGPHGFSPRARSI